MDLTSVGGCAWCVSNSPAAVWARREIQELWCGMRHPEYRSSRSETETGVRWSDTCVELCAWYYKKIVCRSLCTPVLVVDRKSYSLISPYQQRNHAVVPAHRLTIISHKCSESATQIFAERWVLSSVCAWLSPCQGGMRVWKRWPELMLVSALRGILLLKNANVAGTNFVQECEQTLKGPFFNLWETSSLIARMNA